MEVKDGGGDGEKMKQALRWPSEGRTRPFRDRQGTILLQLHQSAKKTEALMFTNENLEFFFHYIQKNSRVKANPLEAVVRLLFYLMNGCVILDGLSLTSDRRRVSTS